MVHIIAWKTFAIITWFWCIFWIITQYNIQCNQRKHCKCKNPKLMANISIYIDLCYGNFTISIQLLIGVKNVK
jgi:hypothetical protein